MKNSIENSKPLCDKVLLKLFVSQLQADFSVPLRYIIEVYLEHQFTYVTFILFYFLVETN